MRPAAGDADLTILIPVRDDRRLPSCIASIDFPCCVLVVLNGATAEFDAWVRAACPDVSILRLAKPGLGAAYNAGLAACSTEFVLLMDSDCRFLPGTIARLRGLLANAPLAKGRVLFEAVGPVSRAIAAYRAWHTGDRANAFSPPLAFSRTVLRLTLGHYFDEALAWSEDLDFDRRVQAARLRIEHDPDAAVLHPPLSLMVDLRAAYHYGVGYAVGESKGLFPSAPALSISARVVRDLRHAVLVARQKGFPAGVYSLMWWAAFRRGRRHTLQDRMP